MRVDVPRQHVDAVTDFIIEHICSGLVLEDDDSVDYVGIIFYVSPGKVAAISDNLTVYLNSLTGPEMYDVSEFRTRLISDIAWEDNYRKSVKPVVISDDIVIRPPWEESSHNAMYQIIIEPKMAFGTGRHETTRSCLRLLPSLVKPGMRFLDVGCGTGILSILAGMLDVSYIKAIDVDITAIENCGENFRLNNVTAEYDIVLGSLDRCLDDKPYDMICVNIIKKTILDIFDQLAVLIAPNGMILLSGLLEDDLNDIKHAIDDHNLVVVATYADNEWWTLTVQRI